MFRLIQVFRHALKIFDDAGAGAVMDLAQADALRLGEIPASVWKHERLMWGACLCSVSSLSRFQIGLRGEWYLDRVECERLVPPSRRAFSERGIRYPSGNEYGDWQYLWMARKGMRFPCLQQRRRGFLNPVPERWAAEVPASCNLFPLPERERTLPGDLPTDDSISARGTVKAYEPSRLL